MHAEEALMNMNQRLYDLIVRTGCALVLVAATVMGAQDVSPDPGPGRGEPPPAARALGTR